LVDLAFRFPSNIKHGENMEDQRIRLSEQILDDLSKYLDYLSKAEAIRKDNPGLDKIIKSIENNKDYIELRHC
jgi:hypothetical protein